ncbi:MAG: hypothetical protein LBB18_00375 [Puniceicoccales bacterium]|jgi:hypothetical protein|nr:hypothetical protein [Puniceicoccales bacterium]
MRFLKYLYFAALFTSQLIPSVVTAYEGVGRRLNCLSGRQAEKFLECVRQNSISQNQRLVVTFKLYSASNKNEAKFGQIVFNGPSKYSVTFGEKVSTPTDFSTNKPFFDDLIFAPEDLSFIFTDGGHYFYAGPARILGRPAQQFVGVGGEDSAVASSVKVSIDEKFLIILQVEFIGNSRKLERKISVRSFKNFGDAWMPKIVEFFDFKNHRHAKMEILSVKNVD